MEIREPEFKRGDKVRNLEDGHVYTVESINDYKFMQDEYWYNISDHLCVAPESALELYIDNHKTVWDLKEGDTYYVIGGYGEVLETTWKYNIDSNSRKIGNAFLTKEEAEFEVERRKVETEMIRLGGKRKTEKGKANWFFEYRPSSGGIEILWSSLYEIDQGVIYFESEEKAKKVVEIIGKDRIKKYIFGVEE